MIRSVRRERRRKSTKNKGRRRERAVGAEEGSVANPTGTVQWRVD